MDTHTAMKRALQELKILRARDPYHLTRVKEALGLNKNVVITWIRNEYIPGKYVEDVLEITQRLMQLPVDEPSPRHNVKGGHDCIMRENILCSDHTKCAACGWNPEEEQRRTVLHREAEGISQRRTK